jgi:hypothetical protein
MGDVTGISLDEGKKNATVEFEFDVELNDFAPFIADDAGPNKLCLAKLNKTRNAKAGEGMKTTIPMTLFDDGWRVAIK